MQVGHLSDGGLCGSWLPEGGELPRSLGALGALFAQDFRVEDAIWGFTIVRDSQY